MLSAVGYDFHLGYSVYLFVSVSFFPLSAVYVISLIFCRVWLFYLQTFAKYSFFLQLSNIDSQARHFRLRFQYSAL